jgi:hypothetical protein
MSELPTMNFKISPEQETTSSSHKNFHHSEPNISSFLSTKWSAHSKIKLKYQHEYDTFKEESKFKNKQKLLKLDFIIRNTQELNRILDMNSPEDDNQQ